LTQTFLFRMREIPGENISNFSPADLMNFMEIQRDEDATAHYILNSMHTFSLILIPDVESDCELMWCPTPGCETICKMKESDVNGPKGGTLPVIQCSRCQHVYCTKCRLPVHAELSCGSYRQKLIRQGKLNILDEEPFAGCDSIKKCPFCHVPIEKDSGCAQMMCKRCKHVFCWYCLSSLDVSFPFHFT